MKKLSISLLILAFSVLLINDAFARVGGSRSSGFRSYKSSTVNTPQKQVQSPAPTRPQPGMQPAQPRPSFFNSSMFKMIAGGLLIGALFSMFSGHGFQGFGAPGIIEILLIGGIIYFIYRRFTRSRQQAAMASSDSAAYPSGIPSSQAYGQAEPQPDTDAFNPDVQINENFIKDIAKSSFNALQGAWTKGDMIPVRHLMTDRMFEYLCEQLSQIRSRGLRNIVEVVHIQNVELVETDAENDIKVAVVRIDALLRDYSLDAQDRVAEGSKEDSFEIKEYWAFVGKGLDWKLDDIKQVE